MKTGQPSRRKFWVAAASSAKYLDMVASSLERDELGNCLLMSSRVNLIGITQDLYQGHSLHCTTAAASSNMSLIYHLIQLVVAHRGFEPLISALRGRCPGPLDECAILTLPQVRKAGDPGFEPGPTDPESAVLPLDQSPPISKLTPSYYNSWSHLVQRRLVLHNKRVRWLGVLKETWLTFCSCCSTLCDQQGVCHARPSPPRRIRREQIVVKGVSHRNLPRSKEKNCMLVAHLGQSVYSGCSANHLDMFSIVFLL